MTFFKRRKLEMLKEINNGNIHGEKVIECFEKDVITFEKAMDSVLEEKRKEQDELQKIRCYVCSGRFDSMKKIVVIDKYMVHSHCLSLRPINYEAKNIISGKILGIVESKDLDGK